VSREYCLGKRQADPCGIAASSVHLAQTRAEVVVECVRRRNNSRPCFMGYRSQNRGTWVGQTLRAPNRLMKSKLSMMLPTHAPGLTSHGFLLCGITRNMVFRSGDNFHRPIGSVRWEMLRQGIEVYAALRMLHAQLEPMRNDPARAKSRRSKRGSTRPSSWRQRRARWAIFVPRCPIWATLGAEINEPDES
jgi:hypothetical protein